MSSLGGEAPLDRAFESGLPLPSSRRARAAPSQRRTADEFRWPKILWETGWRTLLLTGSAMVLTLLFSAVTAYLSATERHP